MTPLPSWLTDPCSWYCLPHLPILGEGEEYGGRGGGWVLGWLVPKITSPSGGFVCVLRVGMSQTAKTSGKISKKISTHTHHRIRMSLYWRRYLKQHKENVFSKDFSPYILYRCKVLIFTSSVQARFSSHSHIRGKEKNNVLQFSLWSSQNLTSVRFLFYFGRVLTVRLRKVRLGLDVGRLRWEYGRRWAGVERKKIVHDKGKDRCEGKKRECMKE